jgi:hypothetical protein
MSCCTNILDLGCFPNCEPIFFTVVAPTGGAYFWHFTGSSGIGKYKALFASGDFLFIDTSRINENEVYEVWLEKPNGQKFDFGGYDCLKISTFIEHGT